MKDRALIAMGAIGAGLAALCCLAPLLVVAFGTAALSALLAKAGYVLLPVLLVCVGLIGFRFYRHKATIACGKNGVFCATNSASKAATQ